MISRNTTPPTAYDDTFPAMTRLVGTLYVPEGSKDAYAAATGWKDFVNIVEFDPTDVASVKATAKNIKSIYDTNGKKVDELQKGMNIIVYSDGTTKKVLK